MALGAELSETLVEKPEHMNLEMSILAPSKRKQLLDKKAEDKQPPESRGNNGRSSKSSPMGKDNTWPSPEADRKSVV